MVRHPSAALLLGAARCTLPALLLAGCAGQIGPGGGPVDTVPPAIVRTVPDSNAARVTSAGIELEFSKYVNRRTVEESIFISPPVGTLEYEWRGTTVRATFAEPLRRNTTYVVNIGTDVADVRAGNKMAHGFTLAFTTGDSIDRGLIAGRVFDEKPAGVMIFAYALGGINPDTLNPSHTRPDYIMQTGADGTYALSHLGYGRYRVVAVRDEFRNLLYDRQVDAYGVWRSDIALTSEKPELRDVSFRLTREDTARPFLTSARAVNSRRIAVRFSEPVDTLRLDSASFTVTDTVSGKVLTQTLWYLDFDGPTEAGIIAGEPMDTKSAYRVRASGFVDEAGNQLDSVHASASFPGSAPPDTLPPAVAVSVRDSAREVPVDAPILMAFGEPVISAPAARSVRLLDSSRVPVPFDFRWRGAAGAALVPRHEFRPAAWYTLLLALDSLCDYSGNRHRDSTFVARFRTADLRSTGTLEGTVTSVPAPLRSRVRVDATAVDINPPVKRTVALRRPGPFLFDRLPEGRYKLDAFADVDSSGSYRYGLPHPFSPSAPFGVSGDTVKVRARWGVQGAAIELR